MRTLNQLISSLTKTTALLLALASAQAASTPAQFAKQVEATLKKGSIEELLKLGEFKHAHPQALFFLIDLVPECSMLSTCTVSTAPYDQAAAAEDQASQAAQGFTFARPPQGLLKISMKSKDGSSSGDTAMPFALVGSELKILAGEYTTAKLAELRAKSQEALVDEFFASGIYDPATRERRTDWKKIATKLPANGGPAGAWLAQSVTMTYQAAIKGDIAGVIKAGSAREAIIYAEKDYDGKVVPKALLQLKIRAQTVRNLMAVKVLGGYQYGDDVVLMIEGKTPNAWVVRGPILLTANGKSWDRSGDGTINYPAAD
jgi:hypothetical protein